MTSSAETTTIAPQTTIDSVTESRAATSSSYKPDAIAHVAPSWTLHGDVYLFSWWTPSSQVKDGLPPHAYSPLEASSEYAAPSNGSPKGGVSMVQIIRYRDSPVGPYDELIVVPGTFAYPREDAKGKRHIKKNVRITRIYVSQKHTCYNGRLNWNVPKHLARFDWTDNPDGSTSVKVFPHDYNNIDTLETNPSPTPYFQATFKPWRFVPSFPFATTWADYLGVSTTLVQPPLPQGEGSQGELPGTNRWCKIIPQQYSRRTSVGWFDIAQHRDDQGKLTADYENFWPGIGRWQLGVAMKNATVVFNDCEEVWEPPRSNL